MTKARGAADSIGKAGRGASFLLPAFSPYYVPYFPLFLRARARAHRHTSMYTRPNTHIYIYTRTRVFFPFCPPPPPPPGTPAPPSTSCPILLHPPRRSPSSLSPRRSAPPFVLLFVVVAIVRTCARVCTCASSQSSYARFHVARPRAPAARGRLCTWVNGKMSFETFLGRSRSPHCQSYTREISRSRENALAAAPSFRSTMPVARRRCAPRWRAEFSSEKSAIVSPLR